MRPNSSWDVALDGQRFLVNTPVNEATTPPITVVLNWKGKALMGTFAGLVWLRLRGHHNAQCFGRPEKQARSV